MKIDLKPEVNSKLEQFIEKYKGFDNVDELANFILSNFLNSVDDSQLVETEIDNSSLKEVEQRLKDLGYL